jgi:hypothetical protein
MLKLNEFYHFSRHENFINEFISKKSFTTGKANIRCIDLKTLAPSLVGIGKLVDLENQVDRELRNLQGEFAEKEDLELLPK